MNPMKSQRLTQHLIDPEDCIRCNTCEESCPIEAITHDDNNYVVDANICNRCRACVSPCPTGAIDRWHTVDQPYTSAQQLSWQKLPAQLFPPLAPTEEVVADAALKAKAPLSASKPVLHLYHRNAPALGVVRTIERATKMAAEDDVWHIVLDFGNQAMPVLEGQNIGIVPPGLDANGRQHVERLYSVASARSGEKHGTNTIALTVRRKPGGNCSNYLCDLLPGQTVNTVGPFGSTFLMPEDPNANLIMICTGTGVAPFRAFIQHRLRTMRNAKGRLLLFFGGRSPAELPYCGQEKSLPEDFLDHYFGFSRHPDESKTYVQDLVRLTADRLRQLLVDAGTNVFLCGRRGMESGVEESFRFVLDGTDEAWPTLHQKMLESGRYHVETY
ncbi:4Fe-4S binding protein [Paraburkholderia sp. RL17-347-BIC-D]|uniref:4Fe-4S binding protein n=1 Tax=Paraburkholderia sp. RL17-347-BIC-D TaxID=3031632 RepID=UPI0038BC04AB